MLEPGELLSTMDAKVWADEFMETKARLGEKEFDHAMMLGWFANAIMAGFDEATRRQQATIADLQGQLKAAKAPRMYDCGSCAIGKGFEQRVAQLEGELKRYAGCGHDHSTAWWQLRCEDMENDKVILQRHLQESAEQLGKLQADHARLLGLVRALPIVPADVLANYMKDMTKYDEQDYHAFAALLRYRASLPAQRAKLAQGGASKEAMT